MTVIARQGEAAGLIPVHTVAALPIDTLRDRGPEQKQTERRIGIG